MDLLEIRKKAKGLKDAEAEAAKDAAGPAEVSAEETATSLEADPVTDEGGAPAVPVASAVPEPKPKRKKAGAGRKKAKATEPVPESEPEPEDDAELGDMFLTLSEDGPLPFGAAGDLMEDVPGPEAPEEPPVWDQPPADEPPSPPPHAVDDGPGEAADTGDAVVEYLAFRLGSEEYAVRVEDVLEIIRLQKITDVPRAPGFVRGIISLRGVIIPVFDIKKRLGFDEAEHTRATRIVVVSEEGMPQGVIVDKVTGVVRFPMKTIEPPPAVIGGVEAEYIQGVGRMGDRLLILLNTGRILAMEG